APRAEDCAVAGRGSDRPYLAPAACVERPSRNRQEIIRETSLVDPWQYRITPNCGQELLLGHSDRIFNSNRFRGGIECPPLLGRSCRDRQAGELRVADVDYQRCGLRCSAG